MAQEHVLLPRERYENLLKKIEEQRQQSDDEKKSIEKQHHEDMKKIESRDSLRVPEEVIKKMKKKKFANKKKGVKKSQRKGVEDTKGPKKNEDIMNHQNDLSERPQGFQQYLNLRIGLDFNLSIKY